MQWTCEPAMFGRRGTDIYCDGEYRETVTCANHAQEAGRICRDMNTLGDAEPVYVDLGECGS